MESREKFYKVKFANFQLFTRGLSQKKCLAPLFSKYTNLSFDMLMLMVKNLVVPNLDKLDELLELKLLEIGLSIDDIGIEDYSKFKRYLELFATFYD